MERTTWKHVGRGLCSWYGEAESSSISGGPFGFGDEPVSSPEYPIAEGALVIDKREPLEREPALCIASPMLDVRLGVGEVRVLPDAPLMASVLKQSGGAFALVLEAQDAAKEVAPNDPGPLDHVGPAAYAAWWRKAGARIGWWHGGAVRWES